MDGLGPTLRKSSSLSESTAPQELAPRGPAREMRPAAATASSFPLAPAPATAAGTRLALSSRSDALRSMTRATAPATNQVRARSILIQGGLRCFADSSCWEWWWSFSSIRRWRCIREQIGGNGGAPGRRRRKPRHLPTVFVRPGLRGGGTLPERRHGAAGGRALQRGVPDHRHRHGDPGPGLPLPSRADLPQQAGRDRKRDRIQLAPELRRVSSSRGLVRQFRHAARDLRRRPVDDGERVAGSLDRRGHRAGNGLQALRRLLRQDAVIWGPAWDTRSVTPTGRSRRSGSRSLMRRKTRTSGR